MTYKSNVLRSVWFGVNGANEVKKYFNYYVYDLNFKRYKTERGANSFMNSHFLLSPNLEKFGKNKRGEKKI
jgi:hypothetical protein